MTIKHCARHDHDRTKYGELIFNIRSELGMTQDKASRFLGMGVNQYAAMENGQPSAEVLDRLLGLAGLELKVGKRV